MESYNVMFKLGYLIKATSIVGIGTIISRISGSVREIVMAAWMGTSAVTDAIIVSTRIPTLLRKISTEGSLNNALIPLIKDLEKKHHKNVITTLISKIIIIFSSAFILFFIMETTLSNHMLKILAPGILKSPARLYWFNIFIPFTSLTVLFFFLNGIFGALLNFHQQFFWPAIAPAFWNITLIICISLASYFRLDYDILGPIFLLATIIQTIVTLIPYIKLKIPFKIYKNKESKGMLKLFFKNFFPIMFSASISQVNNVILIVLASFLPEGNATILHRADRLLQVPIGLILALSTTLLPTLTQNLEHQSKIIKLSLLLCFALFLPMSFIFFFWNFPVVKLIFNYGKCTLNDILHISNLIRIYSIGIPAFLLIRIMPIFFFARKQINIPTQGATIHTILNIGFSCLLMQPLGISGLAYASIISSWFHVALLSFYLIKNKYISFKTLSS